jgi:hypothetical protein
MMTASADREDHDPAVWFLALRLAAQPGDRHGIMDDLALER